MFLIGFGSENREEAILRLAESDPSTAVILAAVHFEWMLKRTILKIGCSPTKALRDQLQYVYRINDFKSQPGYKTIWDREVASRFKSSALGNVLGRLQKIQSKALDVRGKVIHGNGTVSKKSADEAISLFLEAGKKLRDFASKHGEDLDSRLTARIKPRRKK